MSLDDESTYICTKNFSLSCQSHFLPFFFLRLLIMMTYHHDCELISLADPGECQTGRDFATSFRNAKDFRTRVEIWVLTKSSAVIRKQDYQSMNWQQYHFFLNIFVCTNRIIFSDDYARFEQFSCQQFLPPLHTTCRSCDCT